MEPKKFKLQSLISVIEKNIQQFAKIEQKRRKYIFKYNVTLTKGTYFESFQKNKIAFTKFTNFTELQIIGLYQAI
jgi:hypothetical protein